MFNHFFKNYALYFVMISVIALTALLEPDSTQWLQFDRELIGHGEIWRILSAHWVHASLNHSISNSLGVLLLAYLAGSSLNNQFGLILVAFTTGFVGLCLYLFSRDLNYYVGLSGAQHGLLLVAPFISRQYSLRMASVIGSVILAKTIWEQSSFYDDMAAFDLIGARVAVDSHLFGCIAGLLCLLWVFYRQRHKSSLSN